MTNDFKLAAVSEEENVAQTEVRVKDLALKVTEQKTKLIIKMDNPLITVMFYF